MLKRGNAFDCCPRAAHSISSGLGCWLHGWLGQATQRCGQTPTCRIRFWCIGGGGPLSGDVLSEEAIFKSQSEPPPLEWLSSGLLDILSRDACCWRRRGQRGSFFPGARWIAGLRIQTARHGPVSWCGVRDSLLSNVTDSKNSDCDGRLSSQDERSLRSGMLPVCCCMPAWVHVCVWRCERASDALPRNSAGSMLPSLTVGNFANAAWLGRSMWEKKSGTPVAEMRSAGGEEQWSKWRRLCYNWMIVTRVIVVIFFFNELAPQLKTVIRLPQHV